MGEAQVEFTVSDYLQQCVWYVLLYLLITWQGWILGIGLYIAIYYLIGYLLKVLLNFELLGAADEFFFFDSEKNRLNIVAFHRYAKMTDVDEFRTTMLKRACMFPRLKSKATKILGKMMLKELSNEEMMQSMNRVMPVISDIHNERQLADFMAKE